MKLTFFGHSAFRLDFDDAHVLVDPFLTGNPAFAGDFAQACAGATHILVTHGHDDHVGDALAIARETGAQIVSNFEICMYLAAQGAPDVNPGNTGGAVDCGPFGVSFTRAYHSASTIKDGVPIYLGHPNGFVVRHPASRTLYIAGDTDIFSDMALIREFHDPKIGILPVGDRFTMNGETAALAARRFFDFEVVVPCHYGTFDLLAPDASSFMRAMQGSRAKVLALKPGDDAHV